MADSALFMPSRPLFYVRDLELNFLPALLGLRETALRTLCSVRGSCVPQHSQSGPF